MKTSEYLYGQYYDKEFVQRHISLFHRQTIWAQDTVEKLCEAPLVLDYFCFDSMKFISYPVRDLKRINDCLEAIKWNQKKIKEANER